MSFSFVQNISTDSFYFIAFTDLENWIFNYDEHYYHDTDSTLKIKHKVDLVELRNPFIDKLFLDDNFKTGNDQEIIQMKYQQAYRLLVEILPNYAKRETDPARVNSFLETTYDAGMMSDYEYEKAVAVIKQQLLEPGAQQLHTIELSSDGYLIILLTNDKSSRKVRVKMFLVPQVKRQSFLSAFDSPRHGYEGCVDEP